MQKGLDEVTRDKMQLLWDIQTEKLKEESADEALTLRQHVFPMIQSDKGAGKKVHPELI